MGRSPLGQLTNLLACINNELTHKTTIRGNKEQTDRNVTETKTRSPLIYVNLNRRKSTVKVKQEVRPLICRPSGCPALWTSIECVALSHTDTHSHTLRHERVDLINQCNLSTVHLKSVVCFRGTRHFFYLNSPHTRPATIPKLTRILSVRRGGLVQLLINTVKTSPRPHTLPKYSYCIPCNSIWEL